MCTFKRAPLRPRRVTAAQGKAVKKGSSVKQTKKKKVGHDQRSENALVTGSEAVFVFRDRPHSARSASISDQFVLLFVPSARVTHKNQYTAKHHK